MKCPNCDHLLHITERQQVEIDYCPSCRGVWLDKGELDKIIQFSNEQITMLSAKNEDHRGDARNYGHKHKELKDDFYTGNKSYPGKYGKKKSFLGDLFDFD